MPVTFDLSYQKGLKLMRQYIDPAHPRYDEYLSHENSLNEIIKERDLFGDTDVLRNRRGRVIQQLNHLARDLLGTSFNDLNESTTLVINRRLYLDHAPDADNTREVPFLSPDPDDSIQLETFLPPRQPDFVDVPFLQHAIANSHGVCKVSLPAFGRSGTGFLVARNLILTSYHVLCEHADEDPTANAREVRIRFGFFAPEGSPDSTARFYRLNAEQPIVEMSPTHELDFVLLCLAETSTNSSPLRLSQGHPLKQSALHILQHPSGGAMKLAIGSNGVVDVYDRRYIQYVTQTRGGSSGAPCFGDSWEVVALHRASRAKMFGSIREGVLMNAIYPRIARYL